MIQALEAVDESIVQPIIDVELPQPVQTLPSTIPIETSLIDEQLQVTQLSTDVPKAVKADAAIVPQKQVTVQEELIPSEREEEQVRVARERVQKVLAKTISKEEVQAVEVTEVQPKDTYSEDVREMLVSEKTATPRRDSKHSVTIEKPLVEDSVQELRPDELAQQKASVDILPLQPQTVVEVNEGLSEDTFEGQPKPRQTVQASEVFSTLQSIEVTEVDQTESTGRPLAQPTDISQKLEPSLLLNEVVEVSETIAEDKPSKYYPEVVVPTESATKTIIEEKAYLAEEITTAYSESALPEEKKPLQSTAKVAVTENIPLEISEATLRETEDVLPEKKPVQAFQAKDTIVLQESILTAEQPETQSPTDEKLVILDEAREASLAIVEQSHLQSREVFAHETSSDLIMPEVKLPTQVASEQVTGLPTSEVLEHLTSEVPKSFESPITSIANAKQTILPNEAVQASEDAPIDSIAEVEAVQPKMEKGRPEVVSRDAPEVTEFNLHEKESDWKQPAAPLTEKATSLFELQQPLDVKDIQAGDTAQVLPDLEKPEAHTAGKTTILSNLSAPMTEEVQPQQKTDELPKEKPAQAEAKDLYEDIAVTDTYQHSVYESTLKLAEDEKPELKQSQTVVDTNRSLEVTEVTYSETEREIRVPDKPAEQKLTPAVTDSNRPLEVSSIEVYQTVSPDDGQKQAPNLTKAQVTLPEFVGPNVSHQTALEQIEELQIEPEPISRTAEDHIDALQSVEVKTAFPHEKEGDLPLHVAPEQREAKLISGIGLAVASTVIAESNELFGVLEEQPNDLKTAQVSMDATLAAMQTQTPAFDGTQEYQSKPTAPAETSTVQIVPNKTQLEVHTAEVSDKEKEFTTPAELAPDHAQVALSEAKKSAVVSETSPVESTGDFNEVKSLETTGKPLTSSYDEVSVRQLEVYEKESAMQPFEKPKEHTADTTFDSVTAVIVSTDRGYDLQTDLQVKTTPSDQARMVDSENLKAAITEQVETNQTVGKVDDKRPTEAKVSESFNVATETSVQETIAYEKPVWDELKIPMQEATSMPTVTADQIAAVETNVQVVEQSQPFDKVPEFTFKSAQVGLTDGKLVPTVEQPSLADVTTAMADENPTEVTAVKSLTTMLTKNVVEEPVTFDSVQPEEDITRPLQQKATIDHELKRTCTQQAETPNELEGIFTGPKDITVQATPSATDTMPTATVVENAVIETVSELDKFAGQVQQAKSTLDDANRGAVITEVEAFDSPAALKQPEDMPARQATVVTTEKLSAEVTSDVPLDKESDVLAPKLISQQAQPSVQGELKPLVTEEVTTVSEITETYDLLDRPQARAIVTDIAYEAKQTEQPTVLEDTAQLPQQNLQFADASSSREELKSTETYTTDALETLGKLKTPSPKQDSIPSSLVTSDLKATTIEQVFPVPGLAEIPDFAPIDKNALLKESDQKQGIKVDEPLTLETTDGFKDLPKSKEQVAQLTVGETKEATLVQEVQPQTKEEELPATETKSAKPDTTFTTHKDTRKPEGTEKPVYITTFKSVQGEDGEVTIQTENKKVTKDEGMVVEEVLSDSEPVPEPQKTDVEIVEVNDVTGVPVEEHRSYEVNIIEEEVPEKIVEEELPEDAIDVQVIEEIPEEPESIPIDVIEETPEETKPDTQEPTKPKKKKKQSMKKVDEHDAIIKALLEQEIEKTVLEKYEKIEIDKPKKEKPSAEGLVPIKIERKDQKPQKVVVVEASEVPQMVKLKPAKRKEKPVEEGTVVLPQFKLKSRIVKVEFPPEPLIPKITDINAVRANGDLSRNIEEAEELLKMKPKKFKKMKKIKDDREKVELEKYEKYVSSSEDEAEKKPYEKPEKVKEPEEPAQVVEIKLGKGKKKPVEEEQPESVTLKKTPVKPKEEEVVEEKVPKKKEDAPVKEEVQEVEQPQYKMEPFEPVDFEQPEYPKEELEQPEKPEEPQEKKKPEKTKHKRKEKVKPEQEMNQVEIVPGVPKDVEEAPEETVKFRIPESEAPEEEKTEIKLKPVKKPEEEQPEEEYTVVVKEEEVVPEKKTASPEPEVKEEKPKKKTKKEKVKEAKPEEVEEKAFEVKVTEEERPEEVPVEEEKPKEVKVKEEKPEEEQPSTEVKVIEEVQEKPKEEPVYESYEISISETEAPEIPEEFKVKVTESNEKEVTLEEVIEEKVVTRRKKVKPEETPEEFQVTLKEPKQEEEEEEEVPQEATFKLKKPVEEEPEETEVAVKLTAPQPKEESEVEVVVKKKKPKKKPVEEEEAKLEVTVEEVIETPIEQIEEAVVEEEQVPEQPQETYKIKLTETEPEEKPQPVVEEVEEVVQAPEPVVEEVQEDFKTYEITTKEFVPEEKPEEPEKVPEVKVKKPKKEKPKVEEVQEVTVIEEPAKEEIQPEEEQPAEAVFQVKKKVPKEEPEEFEAEVVLTTPKEEEQPVAEAKIKKKPSKAPKVVEEEAAVLEVKIVETEAPEVPEEEEEVVVVEKEEPKEEPKEEEKEYPILEVKVIEEDVREVKTEEVEEVKIVKKKPKKPVVEEVEEAPEEFQVKLGKEKEEEVEEEVPESQFTIKPKKKKPVVEDVEDVEAEFKLPVTKKVEEVTEDAQIKMKKPKKKAKDEAAAELKIKVTEEQPYEGPAEEIIIQEEEEEAPYVVEEPEEEEEIPEHKVKVIEEIPHEIVEELVEEVKEEEKPAPVEKPKEEVQHVEHKIKVVEEVPQEIVEEVVDEQKVKLPKKKKPVPQVTEEPEAEVTLPQKKPVEEVTDEAKIKVKKPKKPVVEEAADELKIKVIEEIPQEPEVQEVVEEEIIVEAPKEEEKVPEEVPKQYEIKLQEFVPEEKAPEEEAPEEAQFKVKPKKVEEEEVEEVKIKVAEKKVEEEQVEEQIVVKKPKKPKKVVEEAAEEATVKLMKPVEPEEEQVAEVTLKPRKPKEIQEEDVSVEMKLPKQKTEDAPEEALTLKKKKKPKRVEEAADVLDIQQEVIIERPVEVEEEEIIEEAVIRRKKPQFKPTVEDHDEEEVSLSLKKPRKIDEGVEGEATITKKRPVKPVQEAAEESAELHIRKEEEYDETEDIEEFVVAKKPKPKPKQVTELQDQQYTVKKLKRRKKSGIDLPEYTDVENVTFRAKSTKTKEDVDQEFHIDLDSYAEEEISMSHKVKVKRPIQKTFAEEADEAQIKIIQDYDDGEEPIIEEIIDSSDEGEDNTMYDVEEPEEYQEEELPPDEVEFKLKPKSKPKPRYSVHHEDGEDILIALKPKRQDESVTYDEDSLTFHKKRKIPQQIFNEEGASLNITREAQVEETDGEENVRYSICNYVADNDEAINLVEGEKVYVVGRHSSEWWFVRKNLTAEEGWVPAQYLMEPVAYTHYVQKKLHEKIDKLPVFEQAASGNAEPPLFVERFQEQSVPQKGTISLMAKVVGNPVPEVMWLFNNNPLEPTERVQLRYDGEIIELVITDANPETDSGDYKCIASNPVGNTSHGARVIVEVDEVSFTKKLKKNITIEESQSLTLECETSHIVSTKWFFNNKELSGMDHRVVVEDGKVHKLVIKTTNLRDAGTYVCKVKNKETQSTVEVLQRKPEFIRPLEDYEVKEKEDAFFEVEISSDAAEVTWRKDGEKLTPENKRLEFIKDGKIRKLIIRDATIHDEGEYTCVLEDQESTAELTVIELPPQIIKHMEDVTVTKGETATFEIELTKGDALVKWFKSTTELKFSEHVQLSIDGKRQMLKIFDSEPDDASEYSCQVGDQTSKAKLTVEEPMVDFVVKLPDVTLATKSTDAEFVCELSQPDVEVTWYKKGKKIQPNKKHDVYVEGTVRRLVIHDASDDDAGEVSCTARNVTTTSKLCVEEIKTPPIIISDKDQTIKVKENDDVTMTIKFSGVPQPEATWSTSKTVVKKTNRTIPTIDEQSASLTIKKVVEEDEDEYTVKLVNPVGEAEANLHLVIMRPPKAPGSPQPLEVMHDSITLYWKAPEDDGKAEITEYVLEYQDVKQQKWTEIKKIKDTTFTLTKLQVDAEYIFRAIAINEVGPSPPSPLSPTIRLVAEKKTEKPTVQQPLQDVVSEPDKEVTLTCVFGGIPEPKITWKKNGKIIESTHIRYENRVSKYTIEKTTIETEATYTCVAENEVGSVETSCKLTIREKPTIEIDEKYISQKLKTGNNLTIPAKIRGYPRPEVTWYKETTEITTTTERTVIETTETSSTVTITKLTREDSGRYKVTAKNTAGTTSVDVTVKVIDKPQRPHSLEIKELKKDTLKLEWTPPVDDGGLEVTKYILEKCDLQNNVWMKVGEMDASMYSYSVQKLAMNSQYMFRVYASNPVGVSEPIESEPVTIAKKTDKPTPPRAPLDVSGMTENSFTLSWEPSESDGGSKIIEYIVEIKEVHETEYRLLGSSNGNVTNIFVSNVVKDKAYNFRIFAKNEVGISDALETEDKIIVGRRIIRPWENVAPPSAPQNLRAPDVTSRSVTLDWEVPASNGGSEITGYVVEKRSSTSTKWTKVVTLDAHCLQYTVDNLKDKCEYTFRVFAENSVGLSTPATTNSISLKTHATVPSPPTGPLEARVLAANAHIFEWGIPESDGGAPLLGYNIAIRDLRKTMWIEVGRVPPDVQKFQIKDLQENHEYMIRIYARNEIGLSEPLESEEPYKAMTAGHEMLPDEPKTDMTGMSTENTSSWLRDHNMDADIQSYARAKLLRKDEYFFRIFHNVGKLFK